MIVLDWSNLGLAVNRLSSFQHFRNVCILEGIYSEIIQRKTYISKARYIVLTIQCVNTIH
jgi:hypothetical protein